MPVRTSSTCGRAGARASRPVRCSRSRCPITTSVIACTSSRRVSPTRIQFAIRLDAVPDPGWVAGFFQPTIWTDIQHPQRAYLVDDRVIFEAREDEVTRWIALIDAWIATANASRGARATARDGDSHELHGEDLSALREKFNHL